MASDDAALAEDRAARAVIPRPLTGTIRKADRTTCGCKRSGTSRSAKRSKDCRASRNTSGCLSPMETEKTSIFTKNRNRNKQCKGDFGEMGVWCKALELGMAERIAGVRSTVNKDIRMDGDNIRRKDMAIQRLSLPFRWLVHLLQDQV